MGKLKEIPEEEKYFTYKSLSIKPEWVANTRPDICFSVAKVAQSIEERFEDKKCHLHMTSTEW